MQRNNQRKLIAKHLAIEPGHSGDSELDVIILGVAFKTQVCPHISHQRSALMEMPKLPSSKFCVYSAKATLDFIVFSLISQFPDARPLYLQFPLITMLPCPHTPRCFLPPQFKCHILKVVFPNHSISLNCCSQTLFLNVHPSFYSLHSTHQYQKLCHVEMCLLPVIPHWNISSQENKHSVSVTTVSMRVDGKDPICIE